MHKSSKIKLCLLSLPLMCVAVAAAACSGGDHTHTYSSDWAFDAETHWHPSACSHDTKANKSDHVYVQTVIPPSVTSAGYTLNSCACGYSYVSDPVDSLPVESGDLRYNENGHWKPVLSGGQIDIKEHEYEDSLVAPTCSTYGYTKHTCACGYWYASEPTNPIAHTYNEGVWGHDENGHWHPALCCTAKSGAVAHVYTESVIPSLGDDDGYTEYACKDCGYSYQVSLGHSFSDTLTGDEYEHWRPATCAHKTERADVAEHVLMGTSNVCKVCNQAVTPRLAYKLSANGEYYIVTGRGCISGNAIVIPDTYLGKEVREIADRAFKDEDITSVTIGANVKKIGTRAFENTKITAVTLGASLRELGYGAFSGCKDLQTAQITGSLTALPPYAFEDCSSLTSVTCAEQMTEIGAQAFLNCTNLTAFDSSACTKLGFSAFGGCSKYVPAISDNLSVAEEYAFSGCAIVNAVLPATLTQISDNLFNGCEKLTAVELTATSVGKSAFEGCILLDTVTLGGVELIGDNAFQGCSSLAALTLPESVVRVGENAFKDSGLIQIQDGVQYAANVVIGVNSGVTSVTVKAGAVGIADGAFRGNKALRTVNLGGVRFIGVSAFRNCESLTAITFTESVKLIGANAFRESGLTSVTIPATVKSIGDNAFYDCKSLTSAEIHAEEIARFAFTYTGVGRDLNHPIKQRPAYAKLASVVLGSEVTLIDSNAFQYCPITSIALPAGLTKIGKYAFAQTSLNSITIPASVNQIGEYAFYGSTLTSATFENAQNWKAGKTGLNLSSASQNAAYLKTTYVDIDWIKE